MKSRGKKPLMLSSDIHSAPMILQIQTKFKNLNEEIEEDEGDHEESKREIDKNKG